MPAATPGPGWIAVDLAEAADLGPAVEGVQAVIHAAARTSAHRPDPALSRRVNVEATARLLEVAERAGVHRWVQISTMSAHEGSTSVYGRTKLEADRLVRRSALAWTILQPSLIYGPGGLGLVARTLRMARRLPTVPLVGSGRELIRPVFVDDVAWAALACLERPGTSGQSYMIGGPEEVQLREFLARLLRAAGVSRPFVSLPVGLAMMLARGAAWLTPNPPLTADNVLGVREARRVEIGPAVADLGFQPMGLEEGLRRTLGRRREASAPRPEASP